MRRIVLVGLLAAGSIADAQQRDTVIPLDRIVAVVGNKPITAIDMQEQLIRMRQLDPNFRMPATPEEFQALETEILGTLIDEEVLVQQAGRLNIEVADNEITPTVDRQMRTIRSRFASEQEFRSELARAGLGTPEEYRRMQIDIARRTELQQRVVRKMQEEGKMPAMNVTEAEVQEAFERMRETFPRRPATVTFRQIVVAPKPTPAARNAGRAKAESLLAEVKGGVDFERVARRESADSASREQGGDLGWNRRGNMVPEFEQWMFALRPGEMSPVIETAHGFHVIRVDRVQPGEVKARHFLVKPRIDSLDQNRARLEADSVADAWRRGASFDTLSRAHHDKLEESAILNPFPVDSLPATYREAFVGKTAGAIVVFPIPSGQGLSKFVVAQIATREEGGEYQIDELREGIRSRLAQEKAYRRLIDSLRRETYVSIRAEPAGVVGVVP